MAPRGFIIMGVSGCGKTSVGKALAKRLGWDFFDADDFHPPENKAKMAAGIPLNDTDRIPWLDALHDQLQQTLHAGRHPVLACSALKQKYRDRLLAGNEGVTVVHLKGSYDLIWGRMATRQGHYMKADMLQSQFDTLEEPQNALALDIAHSVVELVDQILAWMKDGKEEMMKLAMIGLGRMGSNMALRLLNAGHNVIGVDASFEKAEALAQKSGAEAAHTLTEALRRLPAPRVIWLMLPSGEVTEKAVDEFLQAAAPGDILIDGGNSNYHDSIKHAARCAEKQVHFLDCGTSGGVWGLEIGYCLMVGGEQAAYETCLPIFQALAPEDGCAYLGRSGAGHYAKMVHNGIEYGMMQAMGEGFEILKESGYDFDLRQVADLWNHGSVIRSWLLELVERAFTQEKDLEAIRSYVEDSGEGRWTVQEAIDKNIPAPVITLSLLIRLASRQDESFSAKVIAALRHQFGGHSIQRGGPA